MCLRQPSQYTMCDVKKCKHISDNPSDIISIPFLKRNILKECPECKEIDGFLMCLVCGDFWCMSDKCPAKKGRMSHYAESGHQCDIKMSLIKPYCWTCMSVIEHPRLVELVDVLYEEITGAPKPEPQAKVDIESVLASIGSFNQNWKNFQDRFDDVLKGCLGQAFGFQNCTLSDTEKLSVLDGDVTIENLSRRLEHGEYKNVIVMSGAGISTSANIPDFRTPGTGLYDNLEKYDLPTPQSIFDIDYFDEKPEAFFQLASELFPGEGKYLPTPTHRFIKLLDDMGILLRNYTQNIDGLERLAGIPAEKLVESHGTFASNTCRNCKAKYSADKYKTDIIRGRVPSCFKCSGVVKPDIVFFGEELPQRFKELFEDDFRKCDLLIIMGTSLSVAPFSTLIWKVPQTTPRVLMNREVVGQFDFDESTRYRDIFMGGSTDESVASLVEMCGWQDEFAKQSGQSSQVFE